MFKVIHDEVLHLIQLRYFASDADRGSERGEIVFPVGWWTWGWVCQPEKESSTKPRQQRKTANFSCSPLACISEVLLLGWAIITITIVGAKDDKAQFYWEVAVSLLITAICVFFLCFLLSEPPFGKDDLLIRAPGPISRSPNLLISTYKCFCIKYSPVRFFCFQQ